jgi:cysteine desulfurase
MDNQDIYLDYNSTTPCDARVLTAMSPFFSDLYGNPSNGLHYQGRRSYHAVEEARQLVADVIDSSPAEIIFTGSATESNNLAIIGIAKNRRLESRKKIVVSSIEHKSVLSPCKYLESSGFEIEYLPVNTRGVVSVDIAEEVIDEQTLLVSIQIANNEIGTIQPIQKISKITRSVGAILHCDAAQALGKMEVDVQGLSIDMLSLSAHKVYGPKGVGALFIRNGLRSLGFEPLILGGNQEQGIRSGTLNVPGIVGFGEACQIVQEDLVEDVDHYLKLRDRFENTLNEIIPNCIINAKEVERLPNTSSITFPGVSGDALLMNCDKVMASLGSACSTGTIEPSYVLLTLGIDRLDADSTVRFSLGRFTTEHQIDLAVKDIFSAWKRLSAI